jgi:hypothetical protein
MKYISIILLFSMLAISAYSQDTTGTATLKLRDSILSQKANYVGQPLSKLINALKGNVDFSLPNGAQVSTAGKGYYQDFTLYIGHVTIGFEVTFANKVWVDLGQYHTTPDALWANEMIGLLGPQIVTSLSKPY